MAHFAPSFFILSLLVGCVSVPTGKGHGLSVSGYMTKARIRGEHLHYSISSLLAGPRTDIACATAWTGAEGVSIVDCVGLSEGEIALLASQFMTASSSYRRFSDGLGIRHVQAVLVPLGIGYRNVAEFVEKPARLMVKLSVRYEPGSEALRRSAVRIYAHELVHLDREVSGWQVSRKREEYLASLMESCVELEVFGDSKGYVMDGDIAAAGLEGLSPSQQRSADMFSVAYLDVRSFMGGADPVRRGQGHFEGFCRMTFNSVK